MTMDFLDFNIYLTFHYMNVAENILLSFTSTFNTTKVSKIPEPTKRFGNFNTYLTLAYLVALTQVVG